MFYYDIFLDYVKTKKAFFCKKNVLFATFGIMRCLMPFFNKALGYYEKAGMQDMIEGISGVSTELHIGGAANGTDSY